MPPPFDLSYQLRGEHCLFSFNDPRRKNARRGPGRVERGMNFITTSLTERKLRR
jgi:hypothetical protein